MESCLFLRSCTTICANFSFAGHRPSADRASGRAKRDRPAKAHAHADFDLSLAVPRRRASCGPRARRAPMIVAVVGRKGGIGKTTISVNLGGALAARGLRVLLVDLDSQASASRSLGVPRAELA